MPAIGFNAVEVSEGHVSNRVFKVRRELRTSLGGEVVRERVAINDPSTPSCSNFEAKDSPPIHSHKHRNLQSAWNKSYHMRGCQCMYQLLVSIRWGHVLVLVSGLTPE